MDPVWGKRKLPGASLKFTVNFKDVFEKFENFTVNFKESFRVSSTLDPRLILKAEISAPTWKGVKQFEI
jgi:hypothetical protein